MSNEKGNPRTELPALGFNAAKKIRQQIEKFMLTTEDPDLIEENVSFTLSASEGYLDNPVVDFWVGDKDKQIPNEDYLIAYFEHGKIVYSDSKLLMDGMRFDKENQKETISRPKRYNGAKGDLLDAFEGYILSDEEMIGSYKFNIIKYVRRCTDKNGVEDLEKAKVYIDRMIKFLENKKEDETNELKQTYHD